MNNVVKRYLDHRKDVSGVEIDFNLKENEVLILESDMAGVLHQSYVGQILDMGEIKDKDWVFDILSYVSHLKGKRIKQLGKPYFSIVDNKNIVARYK